MSFDEFLTKAWNEHGTMSAEVAERLESAGNLAESGEQITKLAQLVTHVFGEHLGRWQDGIKLLKDLNKNRSSKDQSECDAAIKRSIAALEVAEGKSKSLEAFSNSDQIRILAVAASALSGQKKALKARDIFKQAVEKAQLGITKSDPANQTLAITGNNLAAGLEEQANRSADETALMIFAAKTARKYWEIAGTWLEIERAEYRLAMTYLAAGDVGVALNHARACLEISREHAADPLELFFGYEVLASVEKARKNKIGFSKAIDHMKVAFDGLSPDDRSWCAGYLRKLQA